MGILLALCTYCAYAIFTCRIVWRILTVLERSAHFNRDVLSKTPPVTILKAAVDIFFFPRLFRLNPRLWIGEWIFHLSFLLVILRHLRYMVSPMPEWVSVLQPFGICAGFTLPFSLLYILAVKGVVEKKRYVSSFNVLFLGMMLFMSITGIMMRTVVRTDIVAIKNYMIGIFSFAPGILPKSALFGIHFATALCLLAYLPAHVFAAPLSVLSAREREDGLKSLMHGE